MFSHYNKIIKQFLDCDDIYSENIIEAESWLKFQKQFLGLIKLERNIFKIDRMRNLYEPLRVRLPGPSWDKVSVELTKATSERINELYSERANQIKRYTHELDDIYFKSLPEDAIRQDSETSAIFENPSGSTKCIEGPSPASSGGIVV